MITINAGQSTSFPRIADAIEAAKAYAPMPVTIHIAPGRYHEKLTVSQPHVTLIGDDASNTILTYDDYSREIMPDGIKRGTFHTYTLFLDAPDITLCNLTVENAKILANYFGVTLPYLLGLDDNSGTDGSKKMTPFQSLVRDRGMSLKEISEATGIGYSTVGNYNQGSRIPNARNAQLLSEYFGVSIPYLLGYEETSMANKPNATILIELVKELSFISEKKSKLLQEYIELDKKERDIIKQIKEIVR